MNPGHRANTPRFGTIQAKRCQNTVVSLFYCLVLFFRYCVVVHVILWLIKVQHQYYPGFRSTYLLFFCSCYFVRRIVVSKQAHPLANQPSGEGDCLVQLPDYTASTRAMVAVVECVDSFTGLAISPETCHCFSQHQVVRSHSQIYSIADLPSKGPELSLFASHSM